MDARSNRVIIPFDDFYDQFSPDMPPKLREVMDIAEFESCIQALNKTITYKLLSARRSQKMRVGILVILGICIVGFPLVVLLLGSKSLAAFLIPPTLCFILFICIAVYSYKMSMTVSQLAARSIEGVLRDFNKKHTQQNMTWRLHKKSTINEDYGFDEDAPGQGHSHSYWIEIEILESNFNILHEASTPEIRPLRAPQPPKSPISSPQIPPQNEPEISAEPQKPHAVLPLSFSTSTSTSASSSAASVPHPSQPLLNLEDDDDDHNENDALL
eukprot:Phypoly_transcript_16348.p1 GENE.Phypoly_transcript_16348~~Phypoly_transcript_16348.p1  ORF type:complete len:284 (+),score=32.54 Phypoly_transcript_16348:40-852(+)